MKNYYTIEFEDYWKDKTNFLLQGMETGLPFEDEEIFYHAESDKEAYNFINEYIKERPTEDIRGYIIEIEEAF